MTVVNALAAALARFDLKTVVEATVRFPDKVSTPCHWWIGLRSESGLHSSQRRRGGKKKKGKIYAFFKAKIAIGYWKNVRASRWLWEQLKGPIPDGYEIDHKCDNGLCVNIEHFECVPGPDNAARANRGRAQKAA